MVLDRGDRPGKAGLWNVHRVREPATRLKCPGRCIRKKPGCGRPVLPSASSEALGQVPGGSGLGVNAEDHGSWPMRWSFLYRIPYRIWLATSHQEVETKIIFPLFRLFRGNGSWCRISRIQSPSHHIIFELKSSPQRFRSFIAHSAQDSTHFHECCEFLISCHRISRIPRT